jgi:hypothetical protein
MKKIRKIIEKQTLEPPCIDVQPYVKRILEIYGNKVKGIFMYGSMLSSHTASSTSFPDFFVITDGYRHVFRRWSHRLTSYVLPPHVYHLRVNNNQYCKYNLISLCRLQRETSRLALDIYILGRFSKRVCLIYARDKASEQLLLECCTNAMVNVVYWTLRGMNKEFDETEFTLACLNISYAGEMRIEAASKVRSLFYAEEKFYKNIYPYLLRNLSLAQKIAEPHNNKFILRSPFVLIWLRRQHLKWFLLQSQIRGILRWPKFLLP